MSEFFSTSAYFGLFLTLFTFQAARWVNHRAGREVLNPLVFSTVTCCLVLLAGRIDYGAYYQGAQYLDVLLTPTTICLAIPLYRRFELLKRNAAAVVAGCAAGVLAHMLGCILLLLFDLEAAQFVTLLPKSITSAIGKSISQELGGYPAVTMAAIMLTGQFGALAAPAILRLTGVRHPMAQGLAIGTASHAGGTSRAVTLGEIQGAASGLAIVVTGLLTVVVTPFVVELFF